MKTQTGGLYKMHHDVDPADDLRAKIGDLTGVKVMGPQILLATYIKPEKTAGSIYIPPTTREEDQYQGKIGLVLALGPTAFKETGNLDFGGQKAKVGDWVMYHVHDGLTMQINRHHCRLLDDVQIRLIVPQPDFLR